MSVRQDRGVPFACARRSDDFFRFIKSLRWEIFVWNVVYDFCLSKWNRGDKIVVCANGSDLRSLSIACNCFIARFSKRNKVHSSYWRVMSFETHKFVRICRNIVGFWFYLISCWTIIAKNLNPIHVFLRQKFNRAKHEEFPVQPNVKPFDPWHLLDTFVIDVSPLHNWYK